MRAVAVDEAGGDAFVEEALQRAGREIEPARVEAASMRASVAPSSHARYAAASAPPRRYSVAGSPGRRSVTVSPRRCRR